MILGNEIQIEQIRYELTWRIRHEVMYPNLPFESIKLKSDPDGIHFGLYANDILTTVVSVFNTAKVYQFRKLATLDVAQNKGYGTMMVHYIINFIEYQGGERIWCNARLSALPFYSKFGFKVKGKHFTENDIDFVIMELELTGAPDA